MPKNEAYLADILNAARAIERFLAGVNLDSFKGNEEKYEAVNRKFEIIGEAARHLSPEVKAEFPGVPWKLITAMRNILIHNYGAVDLEIVWNTAQRDLPKLIASVDAYLQKNPPSGNG